nr:methyltransferase [Fulvivirga lutimaris]
MVSNLVLAAPLLKRKDGKGRIYFIIGQIYQELGFDAEAFNYYRKCLASNPEYELDFYTRLNMAQVTELGKSSDVRAARKVLNSLLKDSKNKEFKDKIYFEIAEFELKQGNRDKAIDNFESSIASSIGNQRQKGQSYLRLGEVYYDTLRSYELAQAYYDSAIQALPQDFENITSIKARQQVLGEFVKNLKTIEVQDSILRLSTLDSAAITAKLNSYLDEQAEKRKEQQKKEERKARRTQASAFNSNTGISSTGWYFGNPSAVALGQSEFKRIWGERPLEDNWRRSIKESVQSLNVNSTPTDVVENTDVANGQTSANIDAGANLNALYREIPFSEDAKQESLNKIEAAYYALGNIYKYDLEEDVNSADAFKTLITRFPETENKPEALYQLYLIYKELNNEEYNTYKNELLNDFPNTVYAKLIANPNYTEESTATNEKLKKIYEKAYGYFTQENYDTTLYILNDAIENYEETVFTSRLKLLKILVTGKTEDINLYQYQLSEFIKSNPDSEVAPYAEELLTASRSFLERKRKRLGTEYVKYLEQSHYLVYVYELKSGLTDAISQAIDNYNGKFSGLNLKTSNLILNDELAMILVSDFENKIDAFQYYSDFIKSDPIDEAKRNSKFYKFVITKDNFNIFYQSKDLDAYLKFFEKNYINGIN